MPRGGQVQLRGGHAQTALPAHSFAQGLVKIEVSRFVVRRVGIRDVRGQHFLALLTKTERRLIEVEVFADAIKHEPLPWFARPSGRTDLSAFTHIWPA